MEDQMRNMEYALNAAERRVRVLETALTVIRSIGTATRDPSSYPYAVGRMQQIADFALNPDTLEVSHER